MTDPIRWETVALQSLAERSTDVRWAGFERQALFELLIERCLLTLTEAADGFPAGHTIWHADA